MHTAASTADARSVKNPVTLPPGLARLSTNPADRIGGLGKDDWNGPRQTPYDASGAPE